MNNDIKIYQKKFEHERSYLFCINNVNTKNMYITTHTYDYKNYSKFIFDDYNQKELSLRLSKLTPRAENYLKEIFLNKDNNFYK